LYTTGDILYASGGTVLSKLASGAANTVLRSTATSTAPSYGKVALATDVSGILPIANGGTGYNADGVSVFKFDTTPTTTAANPGELSWNSVDNTLDLKLAGGVTLQVGQESNIYVHNAQNAIIPNGSVVYIFGSTLVTGGAVPAIKLATNADATAKKTLGVTTQEIPINGYGYVTTQGLVRQLDTTAYAAGTPLYLGTGGALTVTEPAYPATSVRVAISVLADTDNGSIYVQPQLFSDGRVSGTFQWGTAVGTGSAQTVTGLSSTSEVIIQQRGSSVVSSFYSVACSTNQFIPYAVASSGGGALPIATTEFSYIAFI